MKITLSPLVAELRGRAAGAVCAVTRGIQYVKKHARPGGPPTEAQLAHRAHVARLGRWWRSLPLEVRAFLNVLAAENNTTGYALFSRVCASLHSPVYEPTIVPDNPTCAQLASLTATPGMYPGRINVTWKNGHADPDHYVHLFTTLYAPAPPFNMQDDKITYHPDSTHTVSEPYPIIYDLLPGNFYWVIGLVGPALAMPDCTTFAGGVIDTSYAEPPP